MTYLYNYLMNMVDRGNQRRSIYPIQQRQQKAWKALFFNLVNVAVVNTFLLSFHSGLSKNERFDDHLKFREALYKALFAHSDQQKLVLGFAGGRQYEMYWVQS